MRVYGLWGGLRRTARTRMSRAGWRLRTRGRSMLSRGARLTGATVAAFVAAELVGLRDPPPLIAALTALLVVEATLASTLVSGLQRVLSVVAGVALAVVLASIVGLTWWSLGALVAASIVVGQLLRLGPLRVYGLVAAISVTRSRYNTDVEDLLAFASLITEARQHIIQAVAARTAPAVPGPTLPEADTGQRSGSGPATARLERLIAALITTTDGLEPAGRQLGRQIGANRATAAKLMETAAEGGLAAPFCQ